MRYKPYPVSDRRLYRCIAIAVSQQRWLGGWEYTIWEKGLSQDLYHELVTAGVEAYRENLDPDSDFKAIKNIAQRRLYHFLSAYGIHRGWDPVQKKQLKGFQSREACVGEFKFDISAPDAEPNLIRIAIIQRFGPDAWDELCNWVNDRRKKRKPPVVDQVVRYLKKEVLV